MSGQHYPAEGKLGLPLLEQSSARAWPSYAWKAAAFLPQEKQETVDSKNCGEGAGSQSCCLGLDHPAYLREHHEPCLEGEMVVTPGKPDALKQTGVLMEFLSQQM